MKINEIVDRMIELGREIQRVFPRFYLAGGTALMIKYKHRISEDMDFLSERFFSKMRLLQKFKRFFQMEKVEIGEDNIDFFTQGIKISFVYFPFKNVKRLVKYEGLKMASDYDIFLNKIYAAGRRIEPKDIYDIAFLYERYKWVKEKVKMDFEKKFYGQSFEIFLGAVFSLEDYPALDENARKIIERMIKEWT